MNSSLLKQIGKSLTTVISIRALAVSSVLQQKAASDSIQKLFADKCREYGSKSKAAGGKIVDSTPEIDNALKETILRVDRQFGASGKDFTKFPTFDFKEPTLESVGSGSRMESDLQGAEFEDVPFGWPDNKPYYDDVDT